MKKEQKQYLLNEPLTTSSIMGWLAPVMICSAVAGGIAGARTVDGTVLLIVIVATVALVGLPLLVMNFTYLRRTRLYMDETRVWTHIPLQKDRALEWKQIRTAAVVTLSNMNYPTMIVLSIHEPAEVLTRKRMMWKNARRGEELRIWDSESRREVIEERLGMTLPEITL